MAVRLANKDDAAAIAAIYRPYVESSRISFEETAPDAAEIARRMRSPIHPWLVIKDAGRVAGYASTSPMRARDAYRWSVETGIYVASEKQGRGLGGRLLAAHIDLLERQGFVTIVAGIALPNDASVALLDLDVVGYLVAGVIQEDDTSAPGDQLVLDLEVGQLEALTEHVHSNHAIDLARADRVRRTFRQAARGEVG